MWLFLAETLLISIIASVLSVGMRILVAASIVGVLGKIVSLWYAKTAVTGISITWLHPVVGIACGIAASLGAAVFPVLAGSRISPVSAIRSAPWSEEGYFTGKRLNIAAAFFILLAATVYCLYRFSEFTPLFRSSGFLFCSQIFLLLGLSLVTPAFLRGFLSLFHRLLAYRLGATGMLAGLNLRKNINRNAVAVAAIFFGISVFVNSAGFIYCVFRWSNTTGIRRLSPACWPPVGFMLSLTYVAVIFTCLAVLGTVLNKVIPGQSSALLIDLPPMRLPRPANVLRKTVIRSFFFMKEAYIWFFAGSLGVSLLQVSGGLKAWQNLVAPLTEGWLHLPKEAATAFVMGMVRRDFGAAGLTDLTLSPWQVIVSLVVITLFVPCIASLMILFKERGFKEATTVWLGAWVLAFSVGGLLAQIVL
jgi:hypothetical protein